MHAPQGLVRRPHTHTDQRLCCAVRIRVSIGKQEQKASTVVANGKKARSITSCTHVFKKLKGVRYFTSRRSVSLNNVVVASCIGVLNDVTAHIWRALNCVQAMKHKLLAAILEHKVDRNNNGWSKIKVHAGTYTLGLLY